MKSFVNFSTRSKLLIVFVVMLLLFSIALTNAYVTINGLLNVQAELQEKQANVIDFAQLDSNHNESRVGILMQFLPGTPDERRRWLERVRACIADNKEIENRLIQRNRDDSWITGKLTQYQSVSLSYESTRARVIQAASQSEQPLSYQAGSLDEQNERFVALHVIAEELFRQSTDTATTLLRESRESARRAIVTFTVIGAVVILASLFTAWWLSRLISNPLQELLAAAQRIAAGDLRTSVQLTNRTDEVGVLAQSFQSMIDNLRSAQKEIQEGVNVLATSASEIFTATAEIAASASETATAVSQTTSTAEEVKQTAQVSAQKSGHVADVAQKAAQAAQNGRRAIDESISGMQNIREQMELIAETVVRLSEQSQAIGEIISSVNDLAEQSNLLAVNASIEAAKAGEHGKGFAVVAQEIRNLATQSKESTAQIRNILNDVQRATTATVMAAEQGSKAVDLGVKQVNQSGDAIRTLAESIVTAAQAATQITASSQEQLIGIDQVTLAIQSILQASKQNATGTQQAEAGARNLNELGQNLKRIAQRFTV